MTLLYDPFTRGPHPVGVRTVTLHDEPRDHTLTVEVWYPADAKHTGDDQHRRTQDRYRILRRGPRFRQAAVRDASPAALEGAPLIIFSHGLGGYSRQSTFLTTHLASHGYVVAAADHPGSTLHDMIRMRGRGLRRILLKAGRDRVQDIPFMMHALPDSPADIGAMLDRSLVGVAGHSFGGWTSIAATSMPSPVRAVFPLAPIGSGKNPAFGGHDAYSVFNLGWSDRPPTLIVAAELDSICRLRGIERLHAAIGPQHRLLVMRNAEHLHFLDYVKRFHRYFSALLAAGRIAGRASLKIVPYRKLMPEEAAHAVLRAVGLAHFDAHLRRMPQAAAFLGEGLVDALAVHGAGVTVL